MLAEFQETVGASDSDLYAKRLEMAKDFQSKMTAIRKADVKSEQQSNKDKAISLRDSTRAAMAIGDLFFNDSKALRSAAAVVDTYAGVTAALATQNYAGAAFTLATGLANVAAINQTTKGSTGGAATAITNPVNNTPDQGTNNLEVSSVIEGQETTVQQVRLSEDDYDNLSDAIARKIAGRS